MQGNTKIKPSDKEPVLASKKTARKAKKTSSSDSTQLYLNDLTGSELLTAEEEVYYGRLVQQGDQPARQRMIESNLRLVVKFQDVI
ncbi:MAG: sigma-70 factor domain-containing protein [Cycloclasticus sp.]